MSPAQRVPILLVDDNPGNLLALVAVLESPGYELVTAGSGEEALEKILERDFAAVLLDVHMPGLDGYETARRIKQLEKGHELPIVFVTAVFREPEDIRRGYEVGALDYLGKPFDEGLLRAKVGIYADLFAGKHHPPKSDAVEVAQCLRLSRDAIVVRWKALVLGDPDLRARELEERELRDDVPPLIECIADAVEQPLKLPALVEDERAKTHARHRVHTDYTIGETLRELSHLREAIHAELNACGVEPDHRSARSLDRCIDKIMVEAVVEKR